MPWRCMCKRRVYVDKRLLRHSPIGNRTSKVSGIAGRQHRDERVEAPLHRRFPQRGLLQSGEWMWAAELAVQHVCLRHSSAGARIKGLRRAKVNQLAGLHGQGCDGTGARHAETHERRSGGVAEPSVRKSTVVEPPSNPTAPTAGVQDGT